MKMLSKFIKGQKGQALPIVLVLLVLGGLVIAPTLRYASTSLKGHEVVERKGDELYAADSGIDYALFKLSNGETAIADDYQLNGKTVSVNITDMGDGSYLITSTASSAGGSSTTIRTGVSGGAEFAYLLDNAITSNGDIILQPGSSVVGNVTASGTVDGEENVTGNVTDNAPLDNWPSAEDFSTYYWDDVKDSEFTEDYIDVAEHPNIGPLHRNGSLDIYNSDNKVVYNATLEGTVYVTSNLKIGTTKHDFILDLNKQTIYCESEIYVGEQCTITGSGCIIAVGDVDFRPNLAVGNEDDFVFIMSVTGTTTLQPSGSFYGSIAGDADVTLQPGCYLEWNSLGGEGDLSFPPDVGVVGGSTEDMVLGGWDVS